MFKVAIRVESNKLWMIKDGFYHDYIRLVGPLFFRLRKHIAYEN